MNKYTTKPFAKKMLLIGGLIWATTLLASFIILWNVYGLAGSSFDTDSPATNDSDGLVVWGVIARINLYVQYAAYVILALGVLNLIIASHKRHK